MGQWLDDLGFLGCEKQVLSLSIAIFALENLFTSGLGGGILAGVRRDGKGFYLHRIIKRRSRSQLQCY